MSRLTYKSGQIEDIANIIVVPFILAIVFIVLAGLFSDINDGWQTDISNNLSREIVAENEAKFVPILDNGFIIILVGLILAGIVGLFVIDTHPIMFIVTAIGVIALLLVAAMMTNSFSDVTESGTLAATLSEFTFVPLIMENLFLTVTVIAGIFTVAFFAKLRLAT